VSEDEERVEVENNPVVSKEAEDDNRVVVGEDKDVHPSMVKGFCSNTDKATTMTVEDLSIRVWKARRFGETMSALGIDLEMIEEVGWVTRAKKRKIPKQNYPTLCETARLNQGNKHENGRQ
jgi:hypothetical protein